MMRLGRILVIILTVAIVAAGLPVYAGTHCAMNGASAHACPGCIEKSGNNVQKNKCCGAVDCAIGCSSVGSMNMAFATNATGVVVAKSVEVMHFLDDAVIAFFVQTLERPPKTLS